MSVTQYTRYGYLVMNKILYRTRETDQESLDRMWFNCGYRDSIAIFVESGSSAEIAMVRSGMLFDMRSMVDFESSNAFNDFISHKMFSLDERILLCNQIRSKLAQRSMVRWCGSELESIFNRDLVQNAMEINGLKVVHRRMTLRGVWEGNYPFLGNNDHSSDVMDHISQLEDLGQKKLAVIFHSVAIPYTTMVYIGSAPGDAWTSALGLYPNVRKVISVDPRDLSAFGDERVEHHNIMIDSPDSLFSLLENEGDCVLIWDVRGDSHSISARDEMILREISILNSIISDQRLEDHFFILHLKINLRFFTSYYLPTNGNFVIQPFTLLRDVYEARCVIHLRSSTSKSFQSPSEEVRTSLLSEMDTVRQLLAAGQLKEENLVANMLCSRYRSVDYIIEASYNASVEEISLFSINHNPSERVVSYLSDLRTRGISYITSYFLGEALGNDPYEFPETEIMRLNLGTIVDSRSLIPAKISGIYFLISDLLNSLFMEEEYTSETFFIWDTERFLTSEKGMDAYDSVRFRVSQSRGYMFPKFPMIFSIADSLVSPSGHMLRMTVEFLRGESSLAMMIQKVICNFRNSSKSYIAKEFGSIQVSVSDSKFNQLLRHKGVLQTSIERSDPAVWHSVDEWVLGMEAGLEIGSSFATSFRKEQVIVFKSILLRFIKCQKKGIEIERFLKGNYGSENPLMVSRSKFEHVKRSIELVDLADLLLRHLKALRNPESITTWILSPDRDRNTASLWRESIRRLRIDAHLRDLLVHKCFVEAIDATFKRHDDSKLNPIEFVLNCYGQSIPMEESRMCYILHYWNNPHHPEHRIYKDLFPNLKCLLESCDSFHEVLTILDECLIQFLEIKELKDEWVMNDVETREFVVDLIARKWQKTMPEARIISATRIVQIDQKFLSKRNINRKALSCILSEISSSGRYYVRMNVLSILKTTYPNLYP